MQALTSAVSLFGNVGPWLSDEVDANTLERLAHSRASMRLAETTRGDDIASLPIADGIRV
jgi:hypothetical protein